MTTYVVPTHLKRLAETLLMSTHNLYFHVDIKRDINSFVEKASVRTIGIKCAFHICLDI